MGKRTFRAVETGSVAAWCCHELAEVNIVRARPCLESREKVESGGWLSGDDISRCRRWCFRGSDVLKETSKVLDVLDICRHHLAL